MDDENKFDKIFDHYFAPVSGPVMIAAANIVGAAATIALHKPYLTEPITRNILRVEKGKYKTRECRNIAIGGAILSFDKFYMNIDDKKPVDKFVKKQLKNTRPATRKKAEKFIRKYKI